MRATIYFYNELIAIIYEIKNITSDWFLPAELYSVNFLGF